MGQQRLFGLQFFQFAVAKGGFVELPELELQIVAFPEGSGDPRVERRQLLFSRQQFLPGLAMVGHGPGQAGILVEHIQGEIPLRQQQLLVLGVNVHPAGGGFTKAVHGNGLIVHKTA